uniref:Uncharacterized protein n=1 Tax=Tanacetum cinerariifolium TaxID=118510 RepID=A0A699K5Y8_TANCI|nr:hypothetical protein [Tanacetum cinerariifolium]
MPSLIFVETVDQFFQLNRVTMVLSTTPHTQMYPNLILKINIVKLFGDATHSSTFSIQGTGFSASHWKWC